MENCELLTCASLAKSKSSSISLKHGSVPPRLFQGKVRHNKSRSVRVRLLRRSTRFIESGLYADKTESLFLKCSVCLRRRTLLRVYPFLISPLTSNFQCTGRYVSSSWYYRRFSGRALFKLRFRWFFSRAFMQTPLIRVSLLKVSSEEAARRRKVPTRSLAGFN